MASDTLSRWNSVERWSPTFFLVGGGLLAGHAALAGLRAFTDLTTPPDVFVTAGHLVALAGLLGLYPVVVADGPVLARTATGATVVALACWAVVTLAQFLVLAGVVASMGAVLPGVFFAVVLGSTVLAYCLFALAARRVTPESRTVELLVLAPGGLTAAVVVAPAVVGGDAFAGVLVGGGLSLSMLALGSVLRTWDVRFGRTELADDVTAG